MSYFVSDQASILRKVENLPFITCNLAAGTIKVNLENCYTNPGESYIGRNNRKVKLDGVEAKIKECFKGDLHQMSWLLPKDYYATSSGSEFFFSNNLLEKEPYSGSDEDIAFMIAFIARDVFYKSDMNPAIFFNITREDEGVKVQVVYRQVF